MRLIPAFLLLICAVFSNYCCYGDYNAAVVEYNPLEGPTPNLTVEDNLKNYIYQIEQAKVFGCQIIVFPEYGLTGLVVNPAGYAVVIPNVGTNDFSNETYLLLSLSNAAKEHDIYVVVNILEQVNSSNDAILYYNTNVVFARNGTLVAKYRKINLFGEPNLTRGTELATFTTDFGTFGLFTCADIVYYHPSQSILVNTGVTDIIYPAAWYSYVPFYVSLEVQVGYALANRVNLLTANLNNPTEGIGGSSIIAGDGTILRRILTDRPATSFISANLKPPTSASRSFELMGFDILRNDTRQELENFKNLTDFNYGAYTFKPVDLTSGNVKDEICHGSFCCNFNIVTLQNETNSSEVYKLVAFDGESQFNTTQLSLKFCNLVACLQNDIATCGLRPPSAYTTIFRSLTVWGNWEARPEEFYRPLSLGGNLEPIFNTTYSTSKTDETVGVSYNLTRPARNVVSFGLYVRSGVEATAASIGFGLMAFLVVVQHVF